MDRKNSLRGHDGWLFSRNWIFGGYWLSINDLKWCQRPRGSTAFFWFFVSFLMSDSSKTNQSLTICTKASPRSPEISNAILKQFSKRIERKFLLSLFYGISFQKKFFFALYEMFLLLDWQPFKGEFFWKVKLLLRILTTFEFPAKK